MAITFACGSFTWPASSTDTISISPGFTPSAIMVVCSGASGVTGTGTEGLRHSIGFAIGTGSGNRGCSAAHELNGAAAMTCVNQSRDDCVAAILYNDALDGKLDITTWGSSPVFTPTDAISTDVVVTWYAWGGLDNVQLGWTLEPASVPLTVDISIAWEPSIVLFAGSQATAVNTNLLNDSTVTFGYGKRTDTPSLVQSYHALMANQDDGSSNADTDRVLINSSGVSFCGLGGGTSAITKFTFNQWANDILGLAWTVRGVTGRRHLYLAMKGGSWATARFDSMSGSSPTTISTPDLGFAPVGGLIFGMGGAASGTTTITQAISSIGGFDSSGNRYVVAYRSDDGTGSSSNYVGYTNAAVYRILASPTSITPPSAFDLDYDSIDGNVVTLIVDSGTAEGALAYIIFGNVESGSPQNIDAGANTVTFSAPTATLVIPHDDFKFIKISSRTTGLTISNFTTTPGNLIVACVKWEGSSGGSGIVSLEEGETAFSLGTLANASTDMHSQIAYLLSSGGGTNTYTVDINGTETWIEWFLIEFEPPTETTGVTLDDEDAIGQSSGYPSVSPEIDLGASGAGLVIGFCAGYSTGTWDQQFIPTDVDATVLWNNASYYTTGFYQKLDSGTGVEASAYTSQSTLWDAHIIAFKGPVESGTNIDAGGNTVTSTAPTASLSLGNIDIQAGAQVVNFTIGGAVAAAVNLATGGGASESDDFNRGDGGLGTDWTALTSDTFVISSQQVDASGLSADRAAVRNDFASALGDQYAQAKIWVTGGSQGNYDGPGLTLRGQIPVGSGNYYRITVNKYSGGSQAIGIGKFVDGAWMILGTLDLGATWVDGDTLKATITGYVIEVFVNGVSKGTHTDSGQSFATGYPGISYSSSVTVALIDDWVGGDLAGEGLKVTVTAPDATVTVGQSIAANAQTITFTAPTASVSTGPISVNAGANTITITAPNVTLNRETSINANGNTVAVTNPVVSLGLVASLAAGQNLVTFTNPVVTVDTGGTNIAAGQNLVTFTSPDATLDVGGNNVNLNAGANTVTTTCPTVSVATGGVNIVANGNTVTVTSPVASVSIGGININAGAVTVTVTCPVATIELLSPGINLNAGDQVVVFSNPLASLGLGNANIAGGQNVVNITNPLASISSVVQIAALANTVTITAPTTSYSMGDTQCAAGQNLITFEAPFAYVYIPGTGPAEQSPRATRNRLGKRLDWRHK